MEDNLHRYTLFLVPSAQYNKKLFSENFLKQKENTVHNDMDGICILYSSQHFLFSVNYKIFNFHAF